MKKLFKVSCEDLTLTGNKESTISTYEVMDGDPMDGGVLTDCRPVDKGVSMENRAHV